MKDGLVTVAVVPRERFSMTWPALERMYEAAAPAHFLREEPPRR